MIPTLDQVNVLHRAGRFDEAEQGYCEILEAAPDTASAQHGLGVLLLQTGRAREAIEHLRIAANEQPTDTGVLNALGASQLQIGNDDAAEASFRAAIEQDPNQAQALANLGVTLYRLNDFTGSVEALARAVEVDPKNADTLYNLSRAFRATGELSEAERTIRSAIAVSPAHVEAQVDLGVTKAAQGDRVAAEDSYRQALARDPQVAEAHHNLAQILLQSERLLEGWEAFEWRWQTEDFRGADTFRNLPPWDGKKISLGTLLVWTEQGPGDQILYSSIVPALVGMAPRILLACTARLVSLFERSFPFADVVSQADLLADEKQQRDVTAQIPVGSLGHYFRPDIDAFPDQGSFLIADVKRRDALRERYKSKLGDKPMIGLSWRSGNPRFGAAKSIGLSDLGSALETIDATFVDLQYGDTTDDLKHAASAGLDVIHDPEIDSLVDLDAFAAQVAAMDLVITVSNTTAHVAGSLGVPCWTLVSAGSGQFWYWFLDREDSPWYPSLRLFRQTKPGDWSGVLGDLKAALAGWVP